MIQSPEINAAGKPTQRSIKDADMAREVVRTTMQAGDRRAIVNARILAKYNSERPYDAAQLKSEGLGWRSNFTTKPLPAMIEKVGPRFVEAVDGLKYFTDSMLPGTYPNATVKTEEFRREITDTIRSRQGWHTLLEDICFDNALFGHTTAAWLDEFSWFPMHFDQAESWVTDGTQSDAFKAQVLVLKEVYLPHELFDCIRDSEAAKDAGWHLEETRECINTASPTQLRDMLNTGGTLQTWYENAERELTIGSSYIAGISVITVYTLLVTEVTGKVSHYRLGGTEMKDIFGRENRFESMSEAAHFFTFQKGNGTVNGSKGVGRDIYELAAMTDRIRNETVDRLVMSGKTLVQGDTKRIHTFKMSVIGSTVIIPQNWTVLEQKIEGNVDAFLKLDAYFGQIVNNLIGSTSVPQQGGGEAMRSPEAWKLLAAREEEGKDSRITRFMIQFAGLVQTMQRKLCDPDIEDEDAKAMQERLLKVMSREELDVLAEKPVANVISDLTPIDRQVVVQVANEKKGNPLYNQKALEIEDLTARISADFAEKVLLPDADPTEHVEQNRQQQLEILLLSAGQAVPVSPRDNDEMHLQVLMPAAQQLASQIGQGQFPTAVLEAMLAHINEHYTQALSKGVKADTLSEVGEFVKKIGPALAQLKQLDAQAEEIQQAQSQLAGPPPQEGAAPAEAPPPI